MKVETYMLYIVRGEKGKALIERNLLGGKKNENNHYW